MRERRRAAVAVALAVASAGMLVRSPAQAAGVTVVPTQPMLGFDTPSAQSPDVMSQMKAKGYQAVGVYLPIGDHEQDNRHDKVQTQLTPGWVDQQLSAGWSILPIYLGLQAPNECQPASRQHIFWAMSADPAQSYAQGVAAADDAIHAMEGLGLPADAPVYYDLETYQAGCAAVASYLAGWSAELCTQHHPAGVYGSTGSTMADLVGRLGEPACSQPVAVWPATNNDKQSVTGINRLPDTAWSDHQRTNQFQLDTSVAYTDASGKASRLGIDKNWVDGPVIGPTGTGATPPVLPTAGPCIPAPPGQVQATRGNRTAAIAWTASTADGGSPLTGFEVTDLTTGTVHRVADPGASSLRVTGLKNGTQHTFAVTAVNAVGSSIRSSTVTVTPVGPPAPVAKPTTKVARRSITVSWKPPAANGSPITGYRVSVGSRHLVVAAGKRGATVKNLRPGTYRVTVTAVNAVGAGQVSPAVRVRLRSRP